jgi:hypothetical protein
MKSTDGTQSVTVRLQPPELGQVQIRVDRTTDGTAHVEITAQKPETLQLLQRDQPRLEQLLDQTGVLSSGRSVSFQVAPPDQAPVTSSRSDSLAAGSGGFGDSSGGDASRQHSDTPSESGGDRGSDQGSARSRWFRAGLDITA